MHDSEPRSGKQPEQPDRNEALTPEERAEFDREMREGAAEFQFITEMFARTADGSMSPEEADKWLTALEKIQGLERDAG